jgi:hypothetical protein
MIASHWILIRMRNVSDKICRENQNLFTENFLRYESFLLEVEKYNTAIQATNDSIIRRISFECWITKATDTLSRICNISCFSTAKMVTQTRLNITFIRTLSVSSTFLSFSQHTCRLHRIVATVWATFVEVRKSVPVQRLSSENLPSYSTFISPSLLA